MDLALPLARADQPLPDSPDSEALTVAMAVAPGVYSRNRFFNLFRTPEVRRARARASVVRGIVHHLSILHADGEDVAAAVAFDRREDDEPERRARFGISYRVPALRFERRTELSEIETWCVLYLAERVGVPLISLGVRERDALHAALRRLSGGEGAMLLK